MCAICLVTKLLGAVHSTLTLRAKAPGLLVNKRRARTRGRFGTVCVAAEVGVHDLPGHALLGSRAYGVGGGRRRI